MTGPADPGRPTWAQACGMPAGAVSRLVGLFDAAVRETLPGNALAWDADLEHAVLVDQISGLRLEIAFGNLAALLVTRPLDAWPPLVAHHVRGIADGCRAVIALGDTAFEDVVPRLRLRLFGSGDRARRDLVHAVRLEVAPGLAAAVVVDSDLSILDVTEGMAAHWGVAQDALSAMALEQLRAVPAPVRKMIEDGTARLGALAGDPYASARILSLQPPDLGPLGAIVGVPSRDLLLFVPVGPGMASDPVPLVVAATRQAYAEEPHPVSAQVWWVREGLPVVPLTGARGKALPALRELLRAIGAPRPAPRVPRHRWS